MENGSVVDPLVARLQITGTASVILDAVAGLVPQGKIINISSLESVCKEILIESLDEIKLADITAFIIESESYGFQQPYKRRVLLSAC